MTAGATRTRCTRLRARSVWGTTMDADRLCWITDGAPEEWPVVVWSSEGWYEAHLMGATDFLWGWTGGRLSSVLLADMEPDLAPWFNTFRPRTHRCLRLTEGAFPHDERVRLLREALTPTTDRGSWRSDSDEMGQDHFATVDADWHLTYDASRPHQIRDRLPIRGQRTGPAAPLRRRSPHGVRGSPDHDRGRSVPADLGGDPGRGVTQETVSRCPRVRR
ncbi:hypothetical protein ABZ092_02605 [Streptomyces bobili]|uniref:hypothetical protein n=1 Tax=Streptomyces bobili TaxID=67280 RepID=UPI0033A2F5CC